MVNRDSGQVPLVHGARLMLVYRPGKMPALQCEVPLCGSTRGRRARESAEDFQVTEWICREHWRNVPRRLKLSMRRALRRGDQQAAANRWQACKRAAFAVREK
jgi:hypothetical protein